MAVYVKVADLGRPCGGCGEFEEVSGIFMTLAA